MCLLFCVNIVYSKFPTIHDKKTTKPCWAKTTKPHTSDPVPSHSIVEVVVLMDQGHLVHAQVLWSSHPAPDHPCLWASPSSVTCMVCGVFLYTTAILCVAYHSPATQNNTTHTCLATLGSIRLNMGACLSMSGMITNLEMCGDRHAVLRLVYNKVYASQHTHLSNTTCLTSSFPFC